VIAAKALKDAKPEETRYANLIGVYFSEEDLERRHRQLMEKGFSPYVTIDDDGSRKLYVGAYAAVKSAESFSAELKAKGIVSQIVER
jgi:cell division protein FtsN